MLVLLFELGGERYAIDATQVIEVLPLVNLRPQPRAPQSVAGVFDFRGTPVPVIDLAQLALGRPASRRLSTRVIVVSGVGRSGSGPMGLLAERATETTRRAATDFVRSPIAGDETPYFGPVATDKAGLLQLIDVQRLVAKFLPMEAAATPVERHALS